MTWSDRVVSNAASLWALLTSAVRLLGKCRCDHLKAGREVFLARAKDLLKRTEAR